MTSNAPSRREPSLRTIDSFSRRSSLVSNPDVFSDDYALEPIDSNLNLSLEDSIDPEDPFSNQYSNVVPYPALPPRLSQINRPTSTNKRPANGEASSSARDSPSVRTLSTSSRITIPRSQSPYTGPTAPSHPYAMYPQITRASSIASMSTIRHQERPFVSTRGPEHPYSMYPQNTVTEDEDIGTQPIPLGYPGSGFSSSGGPSGSDVGDIVGLDGHIEQLPPYTRFDDNVVAKGDMREINGHSVAEIDTSSSERASLMPVNTRQSILRPSERMQLMEPVDSVEPEEVSEEEARKEGWKEKAHRRVCGGIALWLLVLIVTLVILAGTLGGVIGGVVGRQQGSVEAMESSSATTTIYMDADPATTDSNTPTCPTGKYSIPFNQTEEIRSCVAKNSYGVSWSCLDIAYLGMTIGRTTNGSPTVQFDDYSVTTQQFLYGPQPPDFNGSTIDLHPYRDRDNKNLGVAMFYYEEFDKLIILPSYALNPNSKREVTERDIFGRATPWDAKPLQIGDTPWYCFWNATINEFWIFLEEPANASSTLTTSASSSATSLAASAASNSIVGHKVGTTSTQTSWQPLFTDVGLSYIPRDEAPQPTSSSSLNKRWYTSAYYPTYPRLIKMVEKRKPSGNVQPYCQRMQVLADWNIVPNENNQIIFIQELQYAFNPISAGAKVKRESTTELESNCICEWMSV